MCPNSQPSFFVHGIYDSPWIFAHEKPAGVGAVCLGRTDAVAAGRGGLEAWPQNLGIFMFFFSKETYIKWSTMVNPGINPNIDWLIILGCTTLRGFRTHVFFGYFIRKSERRSSQPLEIESG